MRLLLLRLEGPLQSWGENSRWDERDSASVPTKSGVIGLIACCMGIGRGDRRLEELHEMLRVSVRSDRAGRMGTDFHTVTSDKMRLADGSVHARTIVSHRQYLQDASFLAAVSSRNDALLNEISEALRHPVWAPYLGRKSCVPAAPVLESDTEEYASAEEALRSYPLPERADAVITAELEDGAGVRIRRDVLENAAARGFSSRSVTDISWMREA